MATIKKIESIKLSLSKKVAADGGVDILTNDADVESIKDILEQLESFEVDLEILTKTLIGTIVSKFKKHEVVGPAAKALVKKWKSIAKQTHQQQQKKPPPAAAVAAARTTNQRQQHQNRKKRNEGIARIQQRQK